MHTTAVAANTPELRLIRLTSDADVCTGLAAAICGKSLQCMAAAGRLASGNVCVEALCIKCGGLVSMYIKKPGSMKLAAADLHYLQVIARACMHRGTTTLYHISQSPPNGESLIVWSGTLLPDTNALAVLNLATKLTVL